MLLFNDMILKIVVTEIIEFQISSPSVSVRMLWKP